MRKRAFLIGGFLAVLCVVNIAARYEVLTVKDILIGRNATVGDDLIVADDATIAGDFSVSGSVSLPAGSTDASDIDVGGDAYLVVGQTATSNGLGVAVSGDVGLTAAGVVSISSAVIVNADVNASAAIVLTKLEAVEPGYIAVGSSTSQLVERAVSGDIGLSNTGVASITADSVVNADINSAAAIALSKTAAGTASYIPVYGKDQVLTAVDITGDIDIATNGVSSIAGGAVVNADINAAAAIVLSKTAAGTASYIPVYGKDQVLTAVDITGDIDIATNGISSISSAVIINADVNSAAAIASSKLASDVVRSGDSTVRQLIQSGNVTMHGGTVYTQTFNTAYFNAAVPAVVAMYTEAPDTATSHIYTASLTTNGFTLTVDASKNFSWISIGVKP